MTKKNWEIEPSFTSEGGELGSGSTEKLETAGKTTRKLEAARGISVASYFWTVSMPFILQIITSMPFQFFFKGKIKIFFLQVKYYEYGLRYF